MLYSFAHFIRNKFPFIWDWINFINSFLFNCRYNKRLKTLKSIYDCYEKSFGYKIFSQVEIPVFKQVDFFASQPEDAYTYFRPHGFDEKSLVKNINNKSFLAYYFCKEDRIVGYCFLRSFFYGKTFRGRMVDIEFRGKGISSIMNKFMNDIGFALNLRIFESVSKDNIPSYRSTISTCEYKIVQDLGNNELLLEILANKK